MDPKVQSVVPAVPVLWDRPASQVPEESAVHSVTWASKAEPDPKEPLVPV